MSTPPQYDQSIGSLNPQTERAVHEFVHDAVSQLSELLKDSRPEFDDYIRWESGSDGFFRERKRRVRLLVPTLSLEWVKSHRNYQACSDALKSEAIIASHLDHVVGTSLGRSRLDASHILQSLVYAMVDDEGILAFNEEKFCHTLDAWIDFFRSDRIDHKLVAPLPYLRVPFPLRLNDEVTLDCMTDEEVTRCSHVGVIRPLSGFPYIERQVAVGIRKSASLPKLIRRGDEPHEALQTDEGVFGRRPVLYDHLVVDDVLSALRLFKRTRIRAAGLASWSSSHFGGGGTSYRVLGQWPYGGAFELSDNEVPSFVELWQLLEKEAEHLRFSIRRFNMAFDRGLPDDRIVDLVIAAEALFLADAEKYQGELRFRFALRAAKFIEHPICSEREVFRLMKQAYAVRSTIVHGGSPTKISLPGNPSANLSTLIDAIEDLVRLGLCKALSMKDGRKIRRSDYWDSLVFRDDSLRSRE